MKKIKNILYLSILAISAFCMIGITEVKAGKAENFKVVCDKQTIEPEQIANCYLIAQVTDTVSFVETTIYPGAEPTQQSKNLKIVGVGGPPTNGNVTALKLTNGQGIKKKNDSESLGLNSDHIDSGASLYECDNTQTYSEESYKGCQLFYALKNQSIKHVDDISENNVAALNSHTGYTVIGYYAVSLTDDAPNNDCGRLCVIARYAPANGTVEDHLEGSTSNNCAEIKTKVTDPDDPGDPVDSGSFTSYLVLIGAVFVAVGAIALAKRNSKFYRV